MVKTGCPWPSGLRRMCAVLGCVFCLVAFIAPNIAGKEKGWVPLEDARNLSVPVKREQIKKSRREKAQKAAPATGKTKADARPGQTVYDNQPPVTEKEISSFVELLPRFRKWARQNGEDAHPVVGTDGKPDFQYSQKAALWVEQHNFTARRFFCIMGRLAAGMVIVEEGNDYKGTRPADMPAVAPQELGLVRKHLGELLTAGGPAQPIRAE